MSALTLVPLVLLLLASAFTSAAETALFALSDEERARAGGATERLLRDPQGLLVSMLLANVLSNILFFAVAADALPAPSAAESVLVGLSSLVAIVLVGELLPKAIALRARERVAALAAPPLVVFVGALGPARRFLRALLEVSLRGLGEVARPESGVTAEALAEVLADSAKSGLIDPREADLLSEVVELEGIRVSEIMTPRVDMIALDLSDADEEKRWFQIARALARRLTWLPVVDGGADQVAGQVLLRDILARPDAELRQILQPVTFVPALASVLDLLRVLREKGSAEAVVVDEYGGTAGLVTIENVFEEIVGDLRVEGERDEPVVVALGDGRFRVAGGLSIRDWNERFGREIVPAGFETVGGLVTALLGRIPREGDRVHTGGLVAVVRSVRGRRVESVEMSVEPEERAA